MRWLNKLPGYRGEPPGLEWRLLRRLPVLLLGAPSSGSLRHCQPAVAAGRCASALAAHFQFIDIVAIALTSRPGPRRSPSPSAAAWS